MDGKTINSLIVFVDVRGFTAWADKSEIVPYIDEFGDRLQKLFKKNFKDFFIKNLGDGAMLLKELEEVSTEISLKKLLLSLLRYINKTENGFSKLCQNMSIKFGIEIPLTLGWGITKGGIKKISNDYMGADINKSARFCGIARPFGIVIDRVDFPHLPKIPSNLFFSFYEQERKLKGLSSPVKVWVSKEVATQFITRENLKETPEVHVAGICLKKENGNIYALLAKRNKTRKLFPGLYEGCGGQLSKNEHFFTGVKRHYRLELNIDVEVQENVHKFYFIQAPEEPIIPGIKFLCVYKGGKPYSSNHSEVKWVSESELEKYSEELFIQGLKSDFIEFISKYKEMKTV